MIHITTEDGCLLDLDDSMSYIIWKIKDEFSSFIEFEDCKAIHQSTYWGECVLTDCEECYSKWIIKIARLTLKM
jgi:hypothetical protein